MKRTPHPSRRSPQSEALARSFYTMLTAEGFDRDQVIGLATELLELVGRDLAPAPAQAK